MAVMTVTPVMRTHPNRVSTLPEGVT